MLAKEKTWKHIFNANTEFSQNGTEKQIMPSKTTINWLFNDIWCYLLIACFDWKICVFQQIVVRVYYILNESRYKQCGATSHFPIGKNLLNEYWETINIDVIIWEKLFDRYADRK